MKSVLYLEMVYILKYHVVYFMKLVSVCHKDYSYIAWKLLSVVHAPGFTPRIYLRFAEEFAKLTFNKT